MGNNLFKYFQIRTICHQDVFDEIRTKDWIMVLKRYVDLLNCFSFKEDIDWILNFVQGTTQ